jgi:hypothetical protein
MARNTDWNEDSEAMDIAMKLTDKYPQIFDGIDLSKIKFVRNLSGDARKVGEIKSCGFPFDIDSPYTYYVVIENSRWKELNEAQHALAIMHLLYSVAPGGTDESSSNYGKCRKHDVKDYNVVLAAAGGRYDWKEPGVTDVVNPLEANEQEVLAKMEA